MPIILPHQSVFDLAIETTGSVEGAFLVMEGNPTVFSEGFITELIPGTNITAPTKKVNASVVQYFQAHNMRSTTDNEQQLVDLELIISQEDNYINVGGKSLLKYK